MLIPKRKCLAKGVETNKRGDQKGSHYIALVEILEHSIEPNECFRLELHSMLMIVFPPFGLCEAETECRGGQNLAHEKGVLKAIVEGDFSIGPSATLAHQEALIQAAGPEVDKL